MACARPGRRWEPCGLSVGPAQGSGTTASYEGQIPTVFRELTSHRNFSQRPVDSCWSKTTGRNETVWTKRVPCPEAVDESDH